MRSPSFRILDSERKSLSAIAAIAVGERGAFVLQEINHWIDYWAIRKDKDHYREGYYWVWNSYKQWRRTFPFIPEASLKKVILDLERTGVLISAEFNRNSGNRTKWYRINYEILDELLVEAEATYERIMSDPIDPPDQTIVVDDPMGSCERSNGSCERSNHSCERSTLSTDQSTYLSTDQSTKKRKEAPFSFSLSGRDKESETQNNTSFPAQTKNPNIQDPQTPKPLSPVLPENFGKPILKNDRVLSEYEYRKIYTKTLTDDEDFIRYLFIELKKVKDYFRQFSDHNYKVPVKEFIEISWESTPRGDRRFGVIQDHKDAYDRYKAAQARIEEEKRLERQLIQAEATPTYFVDEHIIQRLKQANDKQRRSGKIFTLEDLEDGRLKESSPSYAVLPRRDELDQNRCIAS